MNTHRNSRSDNEGIISETMETKDPAINQHQDDSSRTKYRTDTDTTLDSDREQEISDENDHIDPDFQKNADIAQDLDEDLKSDKDQD